MIVDSIQELLLCRTSKGVYVDIDYIILDIVRWYKRFE